MCLQFETLETSHHHGLQEHPVSSRAGAMASGEAIIRGNGLEPNGALTDRDGRQRDHLVASRSGSGAAVVDGRSQQEVDISRSTSGTEADRRDWMARRPPEIWPPPELREVVQAHYKPSAEHGAFGGITNGPGSTSPLSSPVLGAGSVSASQGEG
mmetsp:Transcript_35828/g.94040  ORF Transcript_35828/g.94040 Transcript_35828/m.94040 type:complete len:155 (+) Transcript_35828:1239-1703(+)